MQFQIAIDTMPRDEALGFAESVEVYADIIEIGTPLIYRYGLELVREMADRLSQSELLADSKIVDAGALETRMFPENGADIVTLLAGSRDTTVEQAIATAKNYQSELMIDLIDIPSDRKIERIEELTELGCNYFCLHRPSDVGTGEAMFLPEPGSLPSGLKLAVAGGIDQMNLDRIIKSGMDIAIVGSAITQADKPEDRARKYAERLNQ
ncbi:MAG: orotidine 5'-phosphate decarboxylase / HUMPS family protein [Candidatus Bipolaricaulota bacterium]